MPPTGGVRRHAEGGRPRIPRGCYGLPHWNGATLICDARGLLRPRCRVVVAWREDLRLRLAGTYLGGDAGAVRIRVDGADGSSWETTLDRGLVLVMKVVAVHPPAVEAPRACCAGSAHRSS